MKKNKSRLHTSTIFVSYKKMVRSAGRARWPRVPFPPLSLVSYVTVATHLSATINQHAFFCIDFDVGSFLSVIIRTEGKNDA
jgi:hypothetical protein